jgi:hypothetical protein
MRRALYLTNAPQKRTTCARAQGVLAIKRTTCARAQGVLAIKRTTCARAQGFLAIKRTTCARAQGVLAIKRTTCAMAQGVLAIKRTTCARAQGVLAIKQPLKNASAGRDHYTVHTIQRSRNKTAPKHRLLPNCYSPSCEKQGALPCSVLVTAFRLFQQLKCMRICTIPYREQQAVTWFYIFYL